jgi:hypothetical protein
VFTATPRNTSTDSLHLLGLPPPNPHERTPSLSPSSTISSSLSSLHAYAEPPISQHPFDLPTVAAEATDFAKPRGRLRFFSPSSKNSKTPRERSASVPPAESSLGTKLFTWGRQQRSTPPEMTTAQRSQEDGAPQDVFGFLSEPTPPLSSPPSHNLGRTHQNPTLGLPPSPYNASLLPHSSASSTTPRASTTLPGNSSAVRFASPTSSTNNGSHHARTPSDHLDHETWHFVSPTVPSYTQGQRDAPPLEPEGTVRRILRPHPKVKMRTSYGTLRRPPPVPTPSSTRSGNSAATSLRSGRSGGSLGRTRTIVVGEMGTVVGEESDAEGCCRPGGSVGKGKGREVVA